MLCGYTPGPPHKSLLKVSLGAEESVPWSRAESAAEALRDLAGQGYATAALEQTDVSEPLGEAAPPFPLALVIGNEVDGVAPDALAACEHAIAIEQHGIKHSLNVSVAFGIAAYVLTALAPTPA